MQLYTKMLFLRVFIFTFSCPLAKFPKIKTSQKFLLIQKITTFHQVYNIIKGTILQCMHGDHYLCVLHEWVGHKKTLFPIYRMEDSIQNKIWDAIRQNEFEIARIIVLVFYEVVLGIFNAAFSRKSYENWLDSSRDTSSWKFVRQ